VTGDTASGAGYGFTYVGSASTLASDGTSAYSWDPSGSQLAGAGPAGGGTSGVQALTDIHGNLVGQFAAAGTSLLGSKAYDPWGSVTATTGTVTGLLGYQSGWSDPAAGKTLMGSRWYNPSAGDFTSADTVQVSPVPDSAAGSPFAYAGDDPLDYTDPTGHYAVPGATVVLSGVTDTGLATLGTAAAGLVVLGGLFYIGNSLTNSLLSIPVASKPTAAKLNPVTLPWAQPTVVSVATAKVPASTPAKAKAAPASAKSSGASSSSSSSNSQAAEAKAKAAAAAKAKAAAAAAEAKAAAAAKAKAAAAAKAKAAAAARAQAAAEAAARARAAVTAAAAGQAAQARAAAGNAAAAAAFAAGAAAASGDGSVSDGSENGARAGGSPGYGTTGESAPETPAAGGSSIGNGGGTPPTINGGDDLGPRPGGDEPGDNGQVDYGSTDLSQAVQRARITAKDRGGNYAAGRLQDGTIIIGRSSAELHAEQAVIEAAGGREIVDMYSEREPCAARCAALTQGMNVTWSWPWNPPLVRAATNLALRVAVGELFS
jgi:RHS repeat-associated protein